MTAAVLRLKVTLNDVEPKVLRRIEVPADIKLDRLHLTLQAALGWTNSHLFEIRARDVGWGQPSPDWPDGPLDARKAKLIDVLEDAGTISTTTATDGSTRSRSSAWRRQSPTPSIRV